jgi:hypothetical protein
MELNPTDLITNYSIAKLSDISKRTANVDIIGDPIGDPIYWYKQKQRRAI